MKRRVSQIFVIYVWGKWGNKYWKMLTSTSGALFKGYKEQVFIKMCVINALEIEIFYFFKE